MDTDAGNDREAGNSSQTSGIDLSGITRGAWRGSDVSQYEIDWLYRSRRIPEGVSYRLPGDEIEPVLWPGEYVVFLAHFERGFGLPASDFFRSFLDFYQHQPHHLLGNAIFYLSCYATFMEAYIGIRPTRETFARFFALRINSVQGKEIPKPKPPVQCGSCIIGSRQGSPFFKFSGLESCRLWQGTFFYVKNDGAADLINLPPFNPAPPRKVNWGFFPGMDHVETNRVVHFMEKLMKETNICSDDIIHAFISRRVLPLKRRAHKMSEMYGLGDPTKITGLPLSKEDIVLKAKQICKTAMPDDWEWGLWPLSSTNPPTQEAKDRFPRIDADRRGPCRKRPLDAVDPDPYIHWLDLKMGRTQTSRLGNSPPEASGSADDLTLLEMFPQLAPTRRSTSTRGHEFLEKLVAQGQKNKVPASDAGSSQAPPSKRFRTEAFAGKRREALQGQTDADLLWTSPAPSGAGNASASPLGGTSSARRAAPTPPDHRAEEDLVSPPEKEDTGASNIGAEEEAAGRAEPLVPPVPKIKKKKTKASSPSRAAPDTSTPASSKLGQDAPDAPPSPKTTPTPPPEAPRAEPAGAMPTPPPTTLKIFKGKATASSTSSGGQQPLVLHAARAAIAAGEKATGLLGRITEFQREGRELGHLLPYAEKWNAADVSGGAGGLGKTATGACPCQTSSMRLRRAVKELDSAWFDATNNMMTTADAQKILFEELLWGISLRHTATIPEASIEALRTQLAAAQEEKDQLIRQHQEALSAQKTISKELKDQLIQLGLEHSKALKAAQAAAEAKLDEALEDASNSTVVLQAELEEAAKARKAAEDKATRLEAEQKEYDLLVTQTDALAFRLFPDSQAYALKKVGERRVAQAYENLDAPWDPYDHLVALNARVPDTFSLINDRLKGAGQTPSRSSAARAGADSALRVGCSWYPDLDLDALIGVREQAETDLDP
ncbi:hypothetical protein QYE76_069447 [Lolium multiflorum]|uniref:Transposase (putative) gypsy type domain-containing protein n=1 Tax=Lolium multiflorum TaxID=4521 RepID=A0AAD8SI86_LOLMU|nr:hypothetical protein QYE76_069447 [Lolium multiflorum]